MLEHSRNLQDGNRLDAVAKTRCDDDVAGRRLVTLSRDVLRT